MPFADFRRVGEQLHRAGLVAASSGNLSLRLNTHLVITRHGSRLSVLQADDLVKTGIEQDDAFTPLASWELPVHRAIYQNTSARAIVHAHPPSAVAMSLRHRTIAGKVQVVGEGGEIVAGLMGDDITAALARYPLVMVRGHGSFAIGKTLGEAGSLTQEFEKQCRQAS